MLHLPLRPTAFALFLGFLLALWWPWHLAVVIALGVFYVLVVAKR